MGMVDGSECAYHTAGSQLFKSMRSSKGGPWAWAWEWAASRVAVEDRKRSRAMQLVVALHYLLDYLVLWVAIEVNYSPAATLVFDWPFVIARFLSALLFLLTRQPVFFTSAKAALLAQVMVSGPSLAVLDVGVGLVEIGMAGVWALTKEQRMLHWDSRFEISGAFTKQLVFYVAVTVQVLLPEGHAQHEGQFLLLGSVVVLTAIDFAEIYYNPITKAMLLRLDAILLLLTLATIYQDALGLGFLEFLFASVFLFAVAGLHLAFAPRGRSALLRLNSRELGSLPEQVMMEAVIELKRVAQSGEGEVVETYLFKLREQAEEAGAAAKIAEGQEKDAAARRELLNSFIFQTLKRGAKTSKRLRDLVIYLYSPSPRLYSFLDLTDWQHLREYSRIIAEELNDSTLREAEAEKELASVKALVLRYTRLSSALLQELMKERIRQHKVEQYGEQLVQLLEQLQTISANDAARTAEVRDLINRFALECLPDKYHTAMVRGTQASGAAREDLGELVVGGEEDNYLQVLEANSCFTKLAYLRKERTVGRPLAALLPPALLAHIRTHLTDLARQQPQSQPQPPQPASDLRPAFLFNAMGFAVACRWKAEPTTHRTGRAWKLSLRQEYSERALLVVEGESGALEGFSELGRYFGLGASERGKQLDSETLSELRANSTHFVSLGEAVFSDHEFFLARGAVLSVAEQLLLEGRCYLVVEMKETDMKLKSLANPLLRSEGEPPDFQFHFDWSGPRITTEPVQGVPAGEASAVVEQRAVGNYGENITEMRYFQERIDYKSNFEEERDCPSLQPHLQRALSSLSLNEFHEKWDRKRHSPPLWFKASIAIIVLLALSALAGAVFYLTAFNTAAATAGTGLRVSTKLQEKLQSALLLGELTTLPLVNASANATAAITAQIAASNQLSSDLYALDAGIFNGNGGQGILNLLNTLNLHINSYLLTPNYPYRNALTLLTTQLLPAFNTFIATTLNAYSTNAAASAPARAAALICLAVACCGLFVALWLISVRQGLRRREVAEILKFLDNSDLEGMRERTERFKQTWLDNVDSREPEEEDEADHETASAPKHLLSSFRMRKRKVFHAIWLGGLIALLVLLNRQTSAFLELAANYVSFENSLASQVTALQAVWAELNQPAPNVTLIQGLVSSAETSEFGKNVLLKAMAGSGQVGPGFIASYGAFWESGAFCDYVPDAQCPSLIAGAMAEGANMALCYLNIQHDAYLGAIANPPFGLYALATEPTVARLSLGYLPAITQTSNSLILGQFLAMSDAYWVVTQYYFIALVVHALLVLLLVRWTLKDRRTNSRIEELLMIMPFEKLKNFAAFHKYYLKYYATF